MAAGLQEAAGVADTGGREAGGEKELRREVEVEAEDRLEVSGDAEDVLEVVEDPPGGLSPPLGDRPLPEPKKRSAC